MTVPPQIDQIVAGVDALCAGVQSSYLRDVGRYWNFETGWISLATIAPGTSITFERYTHGTQGEGWLLKAQFTNGIETSQKTIDHGPGGFSTDWQLLELNAPL